MKHEVVSLLEAQFLANPSNLRILNNFVLLYIYHFDLSVLGLTWEACRDESGSQGMFQLQTAFLFSLQSMQFANKQTIAARSCRINS